MHISSQNVKDRDKHVAAELILNTIAYNNFFMQF